MYLNIKKIKIFLFYIVYLSISFLSLNYLWQLNNENTSFADFYVYMQGAHHFHMVYDLILEDFLNIFYIFNQPFLYSLQKYFEYKLKYIFFGSYDTGMNETALIVIPYHLIIGGYAFYSLHQLASYFKLDKLIIFGSIFIIFSPSYYFLITFNAYDFVTMSMIVIVTYRMIKFLKFQTLSNLIFFLSSLIVLSNYRNFFHPFLFCIPVLIGCSFFIRTKIKKYIFLSIVCILVSSLNVIKNYIFFDTFLIGIGPYAKAKIYGSYEFKDKKLLLKLIDEKKISPIHICFSQQTMVQFVYKNEEFNLKKCRHEIFEKYLSNELNLFFKNKPELQNVKFLNTYSVSKFIGPGEVNFFNIPSGFIPNTILGLVASKKIIEDVKLYQQYAGKNIFSGIKNSIKQFFRSGNAYMFNIAGNVFNYPNYFSSNLWNLDFFKKLSERKDLAVDTAPRKMIAIIIFISSFNIIFYILGVKKIKSNLFILVITSLMLFSDLRKFLNILFILFVLLSILSIFIFLKKTYEYILFKKNNRNLVLNNKNLFFFIYSIFFYYIFALILTAPGEVERYRMVIDPLILIFGVFSLKRFIIVLRKIFSDIKKIKRRNKAFYIL